MIFRVYAPRKKVADVMAELTDLAEYWSDYRDGYFLIDAPLKSGHTLATIVGQYGGTVAIDEEESRAAIAGARITVEENPDAKDRLELVASIEPLMADRNWAGPGKLVLIESNPHHPEAIGIIGLVRSFLPGRGFMGADIADVEYEDPREGTSHLMPFGLCHLRPAQPEWLLKAAERYDALARELRALAERGRSR